MHPGIHAAKHPEKPAHVMARSGEVVTYRELDDRANRLAQLMWNAGLRPGDHVAILMENHPRYLEVFWAAIRSGLYLTAVNRHLTAEEASYIVNDCEARVLVSSAALGDVAAEMLPRLSECPIRLMVDGPRDGYDPYEEAIAEFPARPLERRPRGMSMLYSSGTTGRPKGIKRPLSGANVDDPDPAMELFRTLFRFEEDSVYLSPAPMYHSAPLGFSTFMQALGGTVVVMETFDAADALASIEKYRCTHGQFVPTMFTRMLKLPAEERGRHDVSSLQVAIHAAAPCPVPVKEQMIEWWGPVLTEYYGGTEFNGLTCIDSKEWLEHKGSVGRAVFGKLHVCNDAGEELPTGEAGTVYFELNRMTFEYHNDPEKTREAQHPQHPNWSTLADMGRVDEDGYLYLTDRKSYMIVSGGVNIYPAEIENVLVTHPKVVDVAVFGVPNEDFGEEVKAVVQPTRGIEGSPELERELIAFSQAHLAQYKCPRSVDFEAELPRLPTGKLYKRLLRDRYWGKRHSRIV